MSKIVSVRFAFSNAAHDGDFKDAGEKNCNLRDSYDEGQLILDSKRTRSAISFRPLPFAFLDGERLPLTGHLSDKATRGVEGLHATLYERARYSDILISGVFLLATSSPPLWDIHPLHGIYYPLSTCALCTLAPSPLATLKTLGDHLTEDSAVSMPRWWLFFHETFLDEGSPDPAEDSNSRSRENPWEQNPVIDCRWYTKLIKILHKNVFLETTREIRHDYEHP